mmetsp:Transcript_36158/g.94693  ORF Transcript_36158/g.94693 Transcript_36158/m.94693 type:complete len:204 (+) Transcript_36158:1313-1924(+)
MPWIQTLPCTRPAPTTSSSRPPCRKRPAGKQVTPNTSIWRALLTSCKTFTTTPAPTRQQSTRRQPMSTYPAGTPRARLWPTQCCQRRRRGWCACTCLRCTSCQGGLPVHALAWRWHSGSSASCRTGSPGSTLWTTCRPVSPTSRTHWTSLPTLAELGARTRRFHRWTPRGRSRSTAAWREWTSPFEVFQPIGKSLRLDGSRVT